MNDFLARSWLWAAIIMHLNWGACLLISPAVGGVTAVATMDRIVGDRIADAVLLILISLAAAYGLLTNKRGLGLSMVLPQQCVLMASAYGAGYAIWSARYLDGTGPMPRLHLWGDQSVYFLLCVFHTISIVWVHSQDFARVFRWDR